MRTYIHERADWPKFHWQQERLSNLLAQVRYDQGRLIGRVESLGFSLRAEAELRTLTQDILKSSEIEGEILDLDQVRSSVARRLGLDVGGLEPVDRHVEGLVEMVLDAGHRYQVPLTKERLFDWQAAMFPTGRSGMSRIVVGAWRDDDKGPMQVVSGPVGREKIHFEAPAAERIDKEMTAFLDWLESDKDTDSVLAAGIAHLWFVTIHPFEDGNGRLARAIADMMLARSEKSHQRFYSMSTQIRLERQDYYRVLESTQSGELDITIWLEWFLSCLSRAIQGAQATLRSVLRKAEFWNNLTTELHPRQKKMLNLLLEDKFHGKLTTSKWAKMTKCSQDTAYRDILQLLEIGALRKDPGGGRSTSYSLPSE